MEEMTEAEKAERERLRKLEIERRNKTRNSRIFLLVGSIFEIAETVNGSSSVTSSLRSLSSSAPDSSSSGESFIERTLFFVTSEMMRLESLSNSSIPAAMRQSFVDSYASFIFTVYQKKKRPGTLPGHSFTLRYRISC